MQYELKHVTGTRFLQQAQGFQGLSWGSRPEESEESKVKAFSTATRSFDVRVIEHKLTG